MRGTCKKKVDDQFCDLANQIFKFIVFKQITCLAQNINHSIEYNHSLYIYTYQYINEMKEPKSNPVLS